MICDGLMHAGKAKDTPGGTAEPGNHVTAGKAGEHTGKLPEELHAHPLMTPAIIVIGEVCALADQFEWYEKLPLSGKKIIVTRPRERQEELSQRLRSLGAEVLELPTISIAPYRAEELPEQGAALEELESYQYLVFTSPSGVDCFFCTADGKKDGYPPVLVPERLR